MAVLLVTHDVDEALALADRVLVLDGGRVAHSWQITLPRPTAHPAAPADRRAPAREVLASLGVPRHPTRTATR